MTKAAGQFEGIDKRSIPVDGDVCRIDATRDQGEHPRRKTKVLEGIDGEIPFNMIKSLLKVELQDHVARLTSIMLQRMNKLLDDNIIVHNTSTFDEAGL